jgi:chorismate synthase
MNDVTIRELTTHAEYAACVALQRQTWGAAFADVVPGSILKVSQRLGGVAAGAFARDGTLLGFVYGLTGMEDGRVVHWSDMLAVRPEAQNLGLGRRLKEFQRTAMKQIGARVIYWTYDPLVARNAHLNFNVFGVRVVEYARDMYGSETGSDLHRGIGTDRLVVAWPVDDDELAVRRRETAEAKDAERFRDAPVIGEPDARDPKKALEKGATALRIAVPADITTMLGKDPALAARWRKSTRIAFESAFGSRYSVSGFVLDASRDRGFYLLQR